MIFHDHSWLGDGDLDLSELIFLMILFLAVPALDLVRL
jgi:hypothetical protein